MAAKIACGQRIEQPTSKPAAVVNKFAVSTTKQTLADIVVNQLLKPYHAKTNASILTPTLKIKFNHDTSTSALASEFGAGINYVTEGFNNWDGYVLHYTVRDAATKERPVSAIISVSSLNGIRETRVGDSIEKRISTMILLRQITETIDGTVILTDKSTITHAYASFPLL